MCFFQNILIILQPNYYLSMKVAIYCQKHKVEHDNVLSTIIENLIKNQDQIYIEKQLWSDFSAKKSFAYPISTFSSIQDLDTSFDIMLTIGGDGTILRGITYIQHLAIPILGINAGRLGFLATVLQEEIDEMFVKIRQKRYKIQERTVLQVLTQDYQPIADLNFALNEITVTRKNTTSMITIETFLDGEYLTSYWADGLIVSTPTGSTGYSLSCGGPVMMPNAESLVLTPIAPHNLNARPLVIPDGVEILLSVSSREQFYFTTFDSRLKSLPCETKILIKKANFNLQMIELEGQNFLKTLRKKLLWGEDTRN